MRNILTGLFLWSTTSALAYAGTEIKVGSGSNNDGYEVKVNIKKNNDSLVYLCNYYGEAAQAYKIDSAKLTPGDNSITFKSTKKIVGGLYALYFKDQSAKVDFILLNGTKPALSFDKTDPVKSLKYSNSTENDVFLKYQNYMMEVGPKFQDLEKKYKAAKTKKDTTDVLNDFKKLNEGVNAFRKKYVVDNNTTFAAKLVQTTIDLENPPAIEQMPEGKSKDSAKYVYFLQHYWDDFDFTDNRLVYTPILESKFARYTQSLVPVPDSVNKTIDMLLSRCKCPDDMFKFTFWTMAKYAGNSKSMGLDESYVYAIEKYIYMNPCDFLDSSKKQGYLQDYYKMAQSLIGRKAKPLALKTKDGKVVDVFDVCKDADYTVVAFYDPDCHHCQKEVPAIDSAINSISTKTKLKIMKYGVENADLFEKWQKFIADNKLDKNWIHVHDPENKRAYVQPYNVYSNPVFYLLDKDGVIQGKRFDHTNLEGLMEFVEKKRKGELHKK